MPSAIYYNEKTISIPSAPSKWQIDPVPKKVVTSTMTGYVETILSPQVFIHITGEFPLIDSASLRTALHQWWQWACRGGEWAITHDVNKVVDTLLAAPAELGDTTITVVDGSGIVIGGIYKLFHGPNFQIVRVTNVAGTSLTLAESLDARYGAINEYCVFRDQNYYWGRIAASADIPIIDATVQDKPPGLQIPQTRFRLAFDFYETLSGTGVSDIASATECLCLFLMDD